MGGVGDGAGVEGDDESIKAGVFGNMMDSRWLSPLLSVSAVITGSCNACVFTLMMICYDLMKEERRDIVLTSMTEDVSLGGWPSSVHEDEPCPLPLETRRHVGFTQTAERPELLSFTHPPIPSFSTISNLICLTSINMWEGHMPQDYGVVADITFSLPGRVIRGSASWMT